MVFPKAALLSVPVVPGQWHQCSVGAGASGCSGSSCCDTELNQIDPDWDGRCWLKALVASLCLKRRAALGWQGQVHRKGKD